MTDAYNGERVKCLPSRTASDDAARRGQRAVLIFGNVGRAPWLRAASPDPLLSQCSRQGLDGSVEIVAPKPPYARISCILGSLLHTRALLL